MASPRLVVLNRSFADPETPTASAFSSNRRDLRHSFSDADYDEGDILDDLLHATPAAATVTPLSQEALRRVPAPSVVSVPDDSASTCSSTTVGDGYTDAEANDDSSSITSMSARGSSVISSQTSSCAGEDVAQMQPVGGVGAGSGGRRRRRRNRGPSAVAATFCASDAGSESPSVPAKARKTGVRPRTTALTAVENAPSEGFGAEGAPSLLSSKGALHKATAHQPKQQHDVDQAKNRPGGGGRNKGKRKGHKSALVTEARRTRHPKLQIGLDLDVELQLKSKVRGDICLTLVLEEAENVVPRASPEIRRNAAGQFVACDEWEDIQDASRNTAEKQSLGTDSLAVADDIEEVEVTRIRRQRPGTPGTQRRELCHLRVGRLNLTRRWWMEGYEMISHIPPPVVAGVAVSMPVAGFAVGWAAANWGGYWPW